MITPCIISFIFGEPTMFILFAIINILSSAVSGCVQLLNNKGEPIKLNKTSETITYETKHGKEICKSFNISFGDDNNKLKTATNSIFMAIYLTIIYGFLSTVVDQVSIIKSIKHIIKIITERI